MYTIKKGLNFSVRNSLFKQSKKYFQIMTPDEYFVNMRHSSLKTTVESCVLKPLPESSNISFKFKIYFIYL
jgi:hypothetical protein